MESLNKDGNSSPGCCNEYQTEFGSGSDKQGASAT